MKLKYFRGEGSIVQVPNILRNYGDKLEDRAFLMAAGLFESFVKDNQLKLDLYCSLEYPYVDIQYRDTYYNYHSSKNFHLQKECIRISFFKEQFNNDDPFNSLKKNPTNFLGILVIRPTINNPFGRMILSPLAFDLPKLKIILREYKFSIRGIEQKVRAFPNSGQDGEFHSCSETSILSVLSYFSKYDNFNSKTPSTIFSIVDKMRSERIIPGRGLKQKEISFILKKFGFESRLYVYEGKSHTSFHNAFNDYVESGFPVIAILSKNKEDAKNESRTIKIKNEHVAHSVICIGYKKEDKGFIKNKPVLSPYINPEQAINDYNFDTSVPREYVFIDDNNAPYRLAPVSNPFIYRKTEGCENYGISGFVVPLVKRIRIDSVRIRALFQELLRDSHTAFISTKVRKYGMYPLISRYFITTTKSYKNFYCSNENICLKLRKSIELLHLPRFLWCIELLDVNYSVENQVIGLVLFDPNNPNLLDSIMFQFFNGEMVINIDRKLGNNKPEEVRDKTLPQYTKNLKTV